MGLATGIVVRYDHSLALEASLHEILQVLSVTLFEQVPILRAFGMISPKNNYVQLLPN